MDFSTIEVSSSNARGTITLNRPEKLNPLSTITLMELVEAARYFDSRHEVKVVVVSGRGGRSAPVRTWLRFPPRRFGTVCQCSS